MTMLRNCMDRMSRAGKTVVPFLNRSHNNSWQVLVGHCVLCVLCSHRISGCYVSDHKAWADKINRRFQSCRTDYNKIAKRGKFGKSGQAKYKNLTALQKWKYEDTPSSLRSTSKVRSHSVSRKLVQCSADSLRQQTMNLTKVPMTAMTVALATHEKKGGNCFIRP